MEHRRAHESELKEKRDNLLTVRGFEGGQLSAAAFWRL